MLKINFPIISSLFHFSNQEPLSLTRIFSFHKFINLIIWEDQGQLCKEGGSKQLKKRTKLNYLVLGVGLLFILMHIHFSSCLSRQRFMMGRLIWSIFLNNNGKKLLARNYMTYIFNLYCWDIYRLIKWSWWYHKDEPNYHYLVCVLEVVIVSSPCQQFVRRIR